MAPQVRTARLRFPNWTRFSRGLGSALTSLQILVEGLPADAKLPGDFGLADAGRNPGAQLHDGRGGEGLFASLIGAPLLGQRDAFALTLMDEGPLEFGEGAHYREQETGHGRVLAGEGELFFDERDPHALAGQGVNDPAQVIEVAGQPIHAVDDDGVAPARKAQQELQLRTLGVFARGFVGEGLIERDPVQLSLCLLVKGADSDVADALSRHRSLKNCQDKVYHFAQELSRNTKTDPILTDNAARS